MGKDGKKGLGMGLGALFGEEYPTAQPEREETAPDLLPIEKIEPRADQPRKRFDPEALELLAESIRTYGLIQPITVRPLDSGFYQIIAQSGHAAGAPAAWPDCGRCRCASSRLMSSAPWRWRWSKTCSART